MARLRRLNSLAILWDLNSMLLMWLKRGHLFLIAIGRMLVFHQHIFNASTEVACLINLLMH